MTEEAAAALRPFEELFTRPLPQVQMDLERYLAFLTRWQSVQNLVSRETLASFWPRHVADSLCVLPLLGHSDRHVLDVGSGGGFPALPLAIAQPGRRFVLIEPNGRKASFLRAAGRELNLQLIVLSQRAEELDSRETPPADVITARAVGPLPQLFNYIRPLFGPETRALLHKGRGYQGEIEEARGQWRFDVVAYEIDEETGSVILDIRNLSAFSET